MEVTFKLGLHRGTGVGWMMPGRGGGKAAEGQVFCSKFLYPQDAWLIRWAGTGSVVDLFPGPPFNNTPRRGKNLERNPGLPDPCSQGRLLSLSLSGTTCLLVRTAWSQTMWMLWLWAQHPPSCRHASLGPRGNFSQDTTTGLWLLNALWCLALVLVTPD